MPFSPTLAVPFSPTLLRQPSVAKIPEEHIFSRRQLAEMLQYCDDELCNIRRTLRDRDAEIADDRKWADEMREKLAQKDGQIEVLRRQVQEIDVLRGNHARSRLQSWKNSNRKTGFTKFNCK